MKQNLRPFLWCDWVFYGEQIIFHCCKSVYVWLTESVTNKRKMYNVQVQFLLNVQSLEKYTVTNEMNEQTNKQTTTMKIFAINFMDGSCCVHCSSAHTLLKKKIYIDSKFVISELLTLCVNNKIQKGEQEKNCVWATERDKIDEHIRSVLFFDDYDDDDDFHIYIRYENSILGSAPNNNVTKA